MGATGATSAPAQGGLAAWFDFFDKVLLKAKFRLKRLDRSLGYKYLLI